MLLRKLKIYNFGPFATPVEVDFEKTVTILTGANDTGKSSVLRLLSYIGQKKPLQEDDVNINRLLALDVSSSWVEDKELRCIATYELMSNYSFYFPSLSQTLSQTIEKGFEVDIEILLAPKTSQYRVKGMRGAGRNFSTSQGVQNLPRTLFVDSIESIGPVIDFSNPTRVDRLLLNLAFGKNPIKRLRELNEVTFGVALRQGEERLNSLSAQILPPSMQIQFGFRKIADSPIKLSLLTRDRVGGFTPFHLRGAGVQKMISLLLYILNAKENNPKESLILLIDEPENSLHADAQHMLRFFLERLAESEFFQVVYATHSPAMLSPLRPHSIRLFRREKQKGSATSSVDNKPIHDNLQSVRNSLGILPSDSLLYAPVTVIVEGITERQILPLLLLRFEQEEREGFDNVKHLLSLTSFLDGHGSSFELWCRLAESQGAWPIIFVDKDKERELRQQRVRENHPDVPIILVGERELEDVIPREVYFKALSEVMENQELTIKAFDEWISESREYIRNMAFTKQIERWLQDLEIGKSYYKDRVMLLAVQKVDLDAIDAQPFQKLVGYIKEKLELVYSTAP